MNNGTANFINTIKPVCEAIEEILSDWKSDNNMQFAVLLSQLQVKMNWDDDKAKSHDPMIRFYIKSSSDWIMNRGAHGGISRASDKLKKINDMQAKQDVKNRLKEQMKAAIEAKVLGSIKAADSVEDFSEEDNEI